MTLACLTIAGVAPAQTPPPARPQRPAFKSGVDLVTLDVSVVDRDGRPVPDLKPEEIVVTVDGAPRPIVSAEFISTVATTAQPVARPRRDYSTNEVTVPGRLIALVVDQGNIRRGGERSVLRAAGRFLERLTPADRVALITIPGPGPTIGFTGDRARVTDALDRVAGQYETREGLHNIAATEALAIEDGDEEALRIVIERECGVGDRSCPDQIPPEARQGALQARRRGFDTLRAFIELLGKMKSIDGAKTLVFISEGLVLDGARGLGGGLPPEIGPLAAQARVSVYVLRLDVPYFDADERKPVHQIDFEAQRQGLEAIAGVTRGSMFTVVGTGASIFDRVAREIAGYYLVGFEAQGRDRDGQRHQVKVTVRRPRVQVRARREFQVPAAVPDTERPSASAAILHALQGPLLLSGMPMRVASYVLLDPDRSKVRISVAAEIGESFAAPAEVGLGYVLSDREGTVIAGQTKRVTLRLAGAGPGALEYRDEFSVAPGDYTFKLAVTDAAGHLGSVDHAVHAGFARIGPIAAADLVLNDDRDAQQRGTQMRVRPVVDSGRLQCALDMKTVDAGSPADLRVSIEVADAAGRTMKTSAATVISSSDGARHVARGTIDTAGLPPGEYVAHAVIAIAGQRTGDVSRQFRIQ